MKARTLGKYLVYVVVLLVIVVAGCAGPRAQVAQLPEGFAAAMVPNMALDGYLYARQSQPTVISGGLVGLPFDPAVLSVEVWAVPSDSSEAIGAVVTAAGQRDAEALFAAIPTQADLWKRLAGANIFLVWGTGSGAEALKKAIDSRQFVPLSEAAKDAWDLLRRLPGPPASKPAAVGFVRMEERLIQFMQKNSRGNFDQGFASAVNLTKIRLAAAGFYSSRVVQITDLMSPAGLKDAGVAGILIAKSSYPGFVISAALGPAASRLAVEKTELDGKTAYYKAVDAPMGEKVHVLFGNSGQYIYAEGAGDLPRAQQLHRWLWGPN